jgi:hypothetical protein
MRKTELDPRIIEWLTERLKGKISEKTIRPAISKIARRNSLTLNLAAGKFAQDHGENLPRRFLKSESKEGLKELRIEMISRHPLTRPRTEKPIIQFAKYETNDKFLKAHLDEINKTYTYGCYTATFILCRKVLENLIIHHILKKKYPTKSLHDRQKYYDQSRGRFLDFNILLTNLRDSAPDFNSEKQLVERICQLSDGFKETANEMTHSRYHIARKKELDEKGYQEILEQVAELERSIA